MLTNREGKYSDEYHALIGGGGKVQSQNQGPSPPKSDSWGRYKVFCLKDHILSAKKKRGPSHITFLDFLAFMANWKPLGEKEPPY